MKKQRLSRREPFHYHHHEFHLLNPEWRFYNDQKGWHERVADF